MSNRPSLTAHVNQSNGGIELALSAGLFGLLGWWLDRRLGLTPILLLSFGMFGFLGSAVSLYYRYRLRMEELSVEAAARRGGVASPTAADATGTVT